ncbi:amidase [Sporolactobacillus sp. THM7-7]|nr:amidase [Sporolactobacillus sp. THM7-7]
MRKKPDLESLRKISTQYHMTLDDEELQSFQKVLSDGIFKSYDIVDKLVEPELPVKYKRTPGYRPSKEGNPLNAWYWKTKVEHAETGKLTGKKLAVKDNVSLAGVPMMNGTKVLEGFVPQIDATVVTRILDEGGEILGKAVCESLCLAGSSFTSDTGSVLNPHNTAYSAGGSSSGSAALVASGEVDMAIGCDQAGSIRIPSSFCGIYGLKPSWGLVPYTGIFPIELTIDHAGPMARTVEDVALLLEVIAGPDGLDPRQYGLQSKPYTKHLTGDVNELRIGIVKEGFGWEGLSEPEVDQMVQEAAESFADCGASVKSVSIPMHRYGGHIWNVLGSEGTVTQMIRGNSHGNNWKGYYQTQLIDEYARGLETLADDLSLTTKMIIFAGQYMQDTYHGRYYAKAQNLTRQLKGAYDKALNDFDILVMPTLPIKATKLPTHDLPLDEYVARSLEMTPNTCVFDLTGHPAMNVPCGTINGLPVGMMLIGGIGQEETVLRAAHAFQTMTHGIYSEPVQPKSSVAH